ncbi:MAG: hypothetical protein KAU90_00160 [Sulfurovaceae bacterium]|nr:hypothetical protein [Sulfurovaceae bacterium]
MNILIYLLITVAVTVSLFYMSIKFRTFFDIKKALLTNAQECKKVKRKELFDNWYYFFWSEPIRFVWISIFVIFFILLGIAFGTFWWVLASVFFTLLYIPFLIFARKSYLWFPVEAKKRLTEFEDAIINGIKKEITFEGDRIQSFSNEDPEFDTEPKIFQFPVNVTKFDYPLFETRAPKKTVIKTRKLEFLVLSREYFSICKGATEFNLLNPKRAPEPKKCAPVKGAGECNEYYYSQMQNVEYDGKAIHIIYNTGTPDVSFPCKKGSHKPAMKALKEKLRLTERQRLKKIEEHKSYEDIKARRLQIEKKEEK